MVREKIKGQIGVIKGQLGEIKGQIGVIKGQLGAKIGQNYFLFVLVFCCIICYYRYNNNLSIGVEEMEKEILNKPNQLISLISSEKITVIQKKAYNIFLKNAQNRIKFDNYEGVMFNINCNLLHKKAGIEKKDNEYIKQELENLIKVIVEISDRDNNKKWEAFPLLRYIKRDEDKYYYKLEETIIKALKEQNFFTPINLLMIKLLSSQYSILFYELSIRYNKLKIPKMSMEEIRKLTNTQNQYKSIKDFKKRVLDAACDEITEKTDIKLSYTTEKRGRKIAYIDFKIERKKEELPKTFKEMEEYVEYDYFTKEQEEKIKGSCKSKITFEVAKKLFKEYPDEEMDYLVYCLKKTEERANSNPVGYFKKVVEELRIEYTNYKELEREKLELKKKMEELEKREKDLQKKAEAEKEKALQDKNSNKYLEAEKEIIKNLQKGYIGEGRYKNYNSNDIPKEIIEQYIKYALD